MFVPEIKLVIILIICCQTLGHILVVAVEGNFYQNE